VVSCIAVSLRGNPVYPLGYPCEIQIAEKKESSVVDSFDNHSSLTRICKIIKGLWIFDEWVITVVRFWMNILSEAAFLA
jgi:hypothetical protein